MARGSRLRPPEPEDTERENSSQGREERPRPAWAAGGCTTPVTRSPRRERGGRSTQDGQAAGMVASRPSARGQGWGSPSRPVLRAHRRREAGSTHACLEGRLLPVAAAAADRSISHSFIHHLIIRARWGPALREGGGNGRQPCVEGREQGLRSWKRTDDHREPGTEGEAGPWPRRGARGAETSPREGPRARRFAQRHRQPGSPEPQQGLCGHSMPGQGRRGQRERAEPAGRAGQALGFAQMITC